MKQESLELECTTPGCSGEPISIIRVWKGDLLVAEYKPCQACEKGVNEKDVSEYRSRGYSITIADITKP